MGCQRRGPTRVSVGQSDNRGLHGHQNQRLESNIVINYVKIKIHRLALYIPLPQHFVSLFGPFSLYFPLYNSANSRVVERREIKKRVTMQSSNGGDMSQDHQQWMQQQQQQQQQWMAMQYPAAAMVMQHQMMYPQHYMPYHHPQPPQQYQNQPPQHQMHGSTDEIKTLWVGDLHQWMDDNYLRTCFGHTGEVKVSSFSFSSSVWMWLCLVARMGRNQRRKWPNLIIWLETGLDLDFILKRFRISFRFWVKVFAIHGCGIFNQICFLATLRGLYLRTLFYITSH